MALTTSMLAAIFLLWGCGDSRVPADVGPSSPVNVTVVFTPVGDGSTFSAQLNGQSFSLPGQSIVSLPPGTYQISGSFLGSGLGVGFQTLGSGGGVQSGSARSLAGPAPQVAPCGITYASPDKAASQSFQLQFQITADAKAACAGSPP
jgi:hypothetical protein